MKWPSGWCGRRSGRNKVRGLEMTRSVTIVNTSNWDGEDWLVRQRYLGVGENVSPGTWREERLRPGEMFSCMIGSPGWEVEVVASDSKEPEPFMLNGKQVVPAVVALVGTAKTSGG